MASLKTEFNQFLNQNYLQLDYKTIYNSLRNILRNSENQEEDLKRYAYTLMENIVQQNITFKNRIPTQKEFAKRRFPSKSAIVTCTSTINFLNRMCVEINPDFKTDEYFGLVQEDFSTIINTQVNKSIIYDSVLDYIKREPYVELVEDINSLTRSIPENTLYNDLSERSQDLLQDIYMKKEMAIRQMESRTKIWKFFCRRAVKNYNEFVEKTEALLRRCQFGDEAIQAAAKSYAQINDQNDDKGHLKSFFAVKKNKVELAKKSRGGVYNKNTANVIRYDEAKALEENTHELEKKMMEIVSKYPGMTPECPTAELLRGECMTYDNTNNKQGFKDKARQIYWNFLKPMIKRQSIDNLNLKEIMFDANKLTLLVMNKYTPIYEDPNLADILPDLSFGTINGESIERAIKQTFPDAEINVKDEAQAIIDEYKKLDNVTLDKQSIGIEKTLVIIGDDQVNLDNARISEISNEEVIESSKVNII